MFSLYFLAAGTGVGKYDFFAFITKQVLYFHFFCLPEMNLFLLQAELEFLHPLVVRE